MWLRSQLSPCATLGPHERRPLHKGRRRRGSHLGRHPSSQGIDRLASNAQHVDEKLTESTEGVAMTTEALEGQGRESTGTDDRAADRTEADRGIEYMISY